MEKYKVRISKGNMKIGQCTNVSLPPVTTCRRNAPCAKDCYALKAFSGYSKNACGKSWAHNLDCYKREPVGYFVYIVRQLGKLKPEFFRWHVGGDIPDGQYLYGMRRVAIAHPQTRFLAFTKQYEIVAAFLLDNTLPSNLVLVLSAWPGLALYNPYGLPVAFMQDGTEDRITPQDLHCPGLCTSCGACWNLKELKKNVWFSKH